MPSTPRVPSGGGAALGTASAPCVGWAFIAGHPAPLPGGAESRGASVLAAAAASVDGRVALGPRAGARVRGCGDAPGNGAPMTLGPCHAHVAGFDLHAGLVTRAGQRDCLERLCRYALRLPLAQHRLRVSAEG